MSRERDLKIVSLFYCTDTQVLERSRKAGRIEIFISKALTLNPSPVIFFIQRVSVSRERDLKIVSIFSFTFSLSFPNSPFTKLSCTLCGVSLGGGLKR